MALSDLVVKQAKTTGKAYTLPDIMASPWPSRPQAARLALPLLLAGKQRMSLGTYPEVSLREARSLRDEARASGQGHQSAPAPQAKARRGPSSPAKTPSRRSTKWLSHRELSLKKGGRPLSILPRIFAKDVLPALGKRSIYDIKRPDLLEVIAKIEKRKALSVAEKVRTWFNQLFRYALVIVPGLEQNPASDLDVVALPLPPVNHNPFLRMAELPKLLQRLRSIAAAADPARLRLLLTGVRTGELRLATPDQFDLDRGLWIIPPGREATPVGHAQEAAAPKDIPPYIVPLSVQAMEIVRHLLESSSRPSATCSGTTAT
jgi:integrase